MRKLTVKPVNYEKVKEDQQGPDENPTVFQGRLVEAFKKYTNVDPSSPEGEALLTLHFIAQSAPDIRDKIRKTTAGPQIPMSDLLQLAYSVFSNRDVAKKTERTQRDKRKAQMMAMALSTQRPPKGRPGFLGQFGHSRPQGPWVPRQNQCALCGQKGHYRKDCD